MKTIQLTHGKFAIVDNAKFEALSKFSWRAVQAKSRWYAKTTIYKNHKPITISMHRFLVHCRPPLVVHHINHNSLDNRYANLQKMSKQQHDEYHKFFKLRLLFKPPTANRFHPSD